MKLSEECIIIQNRRQRGEGTLRKDLDRDQCGRVRGVRGGFNADWIWMSSRERTHRVTKLS